MNIFESFALFWTRFHELNPQRKVDKERCKELWNNCNFSDRKKDAIQNAPRRSNLTAHEYLKYIL